MSKKVVKKKLPPLGSGERFSRLTKELEANPKIENPKALAAYIGRKKYGNAKMQAMAQAGKKRVSRMA